MAATTAARWMAWERRGRPVAPASGGAPPIDTFPTTDLQCRVWIALTPDYTLPWWQWGWANITEYVRWDPGITVTDGRRDESGTVSTINASMVLENDGRFSRRNPFSPYYGFLTRNTPVWAQVNPGSGWYDRLHGYINSWPKRWDTTGTDSVATVEVGGVLRRIQLDARETTPMMRTILAMVLAGTGPFAHWPLEGTSLTAITTGTPSLIASASPFVPTYEPGPLVSYSGPEVTGTSSLIDLGNGIRLQATIADTGAASWTVDWMMQGKGGAETSLSVDAVRLTFAGTSTMSRVNLEINSSSQVFLFALTLAETSDIDTSSVTAYDDRARHYRLTLAQSGADVVVNAYIDGVLLLTTTNASQTLGRLDKVWLNYVGESGDKIPRFGHLDVWEGTAATDTSGAASGYTGEAPSVRLARVCDEENIPFAAYGGTDGATLGPQPTATTAAILADAERGGRGVLYEHEFGLAYKSPRDYFNQPVHFAADQAQGQLAEYVEADDDDQNNTNQWTAKRPDGSSSTYRDPAYTAGDALFAGGDTYNVETDGQLPDIAGWEVHKGTVDEDRWPMLAVNLANHPELIGQWTAMPFGGRVQVANPHEEVGVDLIDAIREGRTEHWNSKQWNARMNTTPASTHTVGVWGDDTGSNTESRWGVNNSTLVTAVSDTATSITVTAPDEPWAVGNTSTDTVNFPLDIDIGGLTYSCTSITGVLADGFGRTVADSWGTDPTTGLTWAVVSGTAADHSVASSRARHNMATRNVNYTGLIDVASLGVTSGPNDLTLPIRPGVVATGADFRVAIETRSSGSSASWARWDVEFRTSGVLAARHRRAISGAQTNFDYTIFPFTYAASDVVWLRLKLDGDDMYGKCWIGAVTDEPPRFTTQIGGATGVPPGTQVGVRTFINSSNSNALPLLVEFDEFTVNDPYTFTVTRLATDKAHAAGAPVTVTDTGTWGI